MGSCCTHFRTARNQVTDVKEVPGDPAPTVIAKFVYWRSCVLCFALVLWALLFVLSVLDYVAAVKARDQTLNDFPEVLREYFSVALKVPIVVDGVMLFSQFIGFVVLFQAFSMRRKNFSGSVARSVAAWLTLTLAALVESIVVPFAAFIDLGKLQRDACGGSLVILMTSGKPFMEAFASTVTAQEPTLAPAMHEAIPGFKEFSSSSWTGLSWCKQHTWSWHSRLFGPFPRGGPMGTLMGNLQPGLARSSLSHAASGMKMKLEDCATESASLVASASAEMGQAERQSQGKSHNKRNKIMMRRDSHSPIPEQRRLSATINADGVVSLVVPVENLAATRRAKWRSRHRAPGGAVSLQTHLRTKRIGDPKILAAKKMAICSTNKALNFLGMLAPMAPEAVVMMYGQMSVLDVMKTGFPLLLTFIPAVVCGICGVKMMLTSSTLPGYLLMILVMGSTPNLFLILAILNQFMASFIAAVGFVCLMLLQGHYLRVAALFSNRKMRSKKKLEAEFGRLNTQQMILMGVFYVTVILYLGSKLYLLKTHGQQMTEALSGGLMELLKTLQKPSTIVAMIVRMRLSGLVSMLGSSDITLYMIFEVMDDDIKVKEKGLKADEATKKLVDDWQLLITGKKPVRTSQLEQSDPAEGVARRSTMRRDSSVGRKGSTGEAPDSGAASAAFQGDIEWTDPAPVQEERTSKKSKGEKKAKK